MRDGARVCGFSQPRPRAVPSLVLMVGCQRCRDLEAALQAAHNARVEARGAFEMSLHTVEGRELARKCREAEAAYADALKPLRDHRDSHVSTPGS